MKNEDMFENAADKDTELPETEEYSASEDTELPESDGQEETQDSFDGEAETSEDKPRKKARKRAKPEPEYASDEIDAPSIDSLLYDSDDGVITGSDEDEPHTSFDDFVADYKAKIEKSLAMAREAMHKKNTDPAEDLTENSGDLAAENDIFENTETEAPAEELLIQSDEDGRSQISIDISSDTLMNRSASEDEKEEDEDDKAPVYDPEKPRIIDSLFDFAELFIFTLAAVLIITTFFFKHTIVEGDSMNNTLYNGEHLIVTDFLYTPKRGDIVVFADYSVGQKTPYVKRVIGVAGDTVTVDEVGNVTVNGEPIDESEYVYIDGSFPVGYYGKEYTVKEGEVFVLGDHRNASYDSASFPYTAVKVESILGKVILRIFPLNSFGFVE